MNRLDGQKKTGNNNFRSEIPEEQGARMMSKDFLSSSAPDAVGTDVSLFHLAGDLYPDLLKVRKPAPFGQVVGMAYIIASHGFLPADGTFFTHSISPYIFLLAKDYII